jgi:hypothetical protein
MERSGTSTRGCSRTTLVVTAVAFGAAAAVGLNVPQAVQAVAGQYQVDVGLRLPKPPYAACFAEPQDQWICRGRIPMEPGPVRG